MPFYECQRGTTRWSAREDWNYQVCHFFLNLLWKVYSVYFCSRWRKATGRHSANDIEKPSDYRLWRSDVFLGSYYWNGTNLCAFFQFYFYSFYFDFRISWTPWAKRYKNVLHYLLPIGWRRSLTRTRFSFWTMVVSLKEGLTIRLWLILIAGKFCSMKENCQFFNRKLFFQIRLLVAEPASIR